MLLSRLLGERTKEKPADASAASHIFLLRGGYIRPVSNGIYSLLPPAKRIASKIEAILREEMDRIGGAEVLFPVALPASLWKESGRFDSVGEELLRCKDRTGTDMVLGMTHEEAAVHLARTEAKSYAQYPFMIYQIQTKFRDEARPRAGLIRVREFMMKDAYSFHTSEEDLEQYYEKVLEAYQNIFRRVGLPEVISVASDTGMMGGKTAHEFMLLCDAGEDSIVLCDACGYRANMEAASSVILKTGKQEQPAEEVFTPGVTDIASLAAFFGVPSSGLLKAAVFSKEGSRKPLIVFLRGDLQVNEAKLRRAVGADIFPYTGDGDSLCLGFIGPVGLDHEKYEILFDRSLLGEKNLICGGNRKDYHIRNLCLGRDCEPEAYLDLAKVNEGDACPHCGKPIVIKRGIEVGNIFHLGTKYTKSMGMTFTDRDGTLKNPVMGCYGIGVGRLLACILEARHDDFGPIWPKSVAPWQVHICLLSGGDTEVRKAGFTLYETLSARFEVLMDDREVPAGVQFADADLLGVPFRLVVSCRSVAKGCAEFSTRDKGTKTDVCWEDVEAEILKQM